MALADEHFRKTLERVLEEADMIAAAYTATEEDVHQKIIDQRPGFTAAEASRYTDYAAAARMIAAVLHKTAMQDL